MRRWAERPSLKFYSLKLAGGVLLQPQATTTVRSASGRSTSTTIHLYMCALVTGVSAQSTSSPCPAHTLPIALALISSPCTLVPHPSPTESHPHLYHAHPKKRPAWARQTAELAGGAASAFVRTLICSLSTALCADKRPTFATSAAWSSCFFVKLSSEGCPDDSESCCPVLR